MGLKYIPYKELVSGGYDTYSEEGAKLAEICKRVDRLLNMIDEHFKDIARPLTTLHVGRALDDEWTVSKERAEELRVHDPEESWQEVPIEKLCVFQEYLCFADDEGWRFYLPAFMRAFLLEFPDHGYVAVCSATKGNSDDRLNILNEEQRSCVAEFANLCQDYEVWFP